MIFEGNIYNPARSLFSGPGLGLALLAAVCLAGCSRPAPAPPPRPAKAEPAPAPAPQQKAGVRARFQGASIAWDDARGRRLMEARFDSASASENGSAVRAELRGVKASLYQGGKVASSLSAPVVSADGTEKAIRASGGVKVVAASGTTSAFAEEITWSSESGRIIGTGGVRLVMGGMTIRAAGFEADTALKKVKFTGAEAELK